MGNESGAGNGSVGPKINRRNAGNPPYPPSTLSHPSPPHLVIQHFEPPCIGFLIAINVQGVGLVATGGRKSELTKVWGTTVEQNCGHCIDTDREDVTSPHLAGSARRGKGSRLGV